MNEDNLRLVVRVEKKGGRKEPNECNDRTLLSSSDIAT